MLELSAVAATYHGHRLRIIEAALCICTFFKPAGTFPERWCLWYQPNKSFAPRASGIKRLKKPGWYAKSHLLMAILLTRFTSAHGAIDCSQPPHVAQINVGDVLGLTAFSRTCRRGYGKMLCFEYMELQHILLVILEIPLAVIQVLTVQEWHCAPPCLTSEETFKIRSALQLAYFDIFWYILILAAKATRLSWTRRIWVSVHILYNLWDIDDRLQDAR